MANLLTRTQRAEDGDINTIVGIPVSEDGGQGLAAPSSVRSREESVLVGWSENPHDNPEDSLNDIHVCTIHPHEEIAVSPSDSGEHYPTLEQIPKDVPRAKSHGNRRWCTRADLEVASLADDANINDRRRNT